MNNKKIITRTYANDDHDLHSLPPIIQKIFLGRGIRNLSEIAHDKHQLFSYHDLLGVEDAAKLLYSNVIERKSILIVGDYDADGATSTALCMKFFQDINYSNVNYLVPNRMKDGYGLTIDIVNHAKKYTPDLIITVDNGITSIDGVKHAKSLGIKTLITDHHLPDAELPPADVIVNPNQLNCKFPSKNLAGVGVVFYVLCCFRAKLSKEEYFLRNEVERINMANYLDLVALGTVADVVSLDHNNRALVQLGLNNIRKGRCSHGISALCEIGGRDPMNLISSDFGFALAPRINAAGRLDDMSIGIKCLMASTIGEARSYAAILNNLNEQRKIIEQKMKQDAFDILSKINIKSEQISETICLYNSKWHEGVIGILAGRIKEKYNRPTIIFTMTPNKDILKGSARSIVGINIKDILERVALRDSTTILKFGGHSMAAGLSIQSAKLEQFKMFFAEEVIKVVNKDMLDNILVTDGEIETDQIDLSIGKKIYYEFPWGQSFPEPSFVGEFYVIDSYVMGAKHLKFTLEISGRKLKGISFNVHQDLHADYTGKKIKIVYRISINNYYDQEELQFIIEQFQLVS